MAFGRGRGSIPGRLGDGKEAKGSSVDSYLRCSLTPSASALRATPARASGPVPGAWGRKSGDPQDVHNLLGKSEHMSLMNM